MAASFDEKSFVVVASIAFIGDVYDFQHFAELRLCSVKLVSHTSSDVFGYADGRRSVHLLFNDAVEVGSENACRTGTRAI